MTEFTKLKMGFALALLGTLFALDPFLDRFDDRGFVYLGFNLKVFYAYALTAGLLSLCVYGYAVALMSDRPHPWRERAANFSYSLAVLIVPIYGGLFLSAELADRMAVSHLAWAAPSVAVGSGFGWIVLSQIAAWRIRSRLGERDRDAKLQQLARQEVESLRHARELFEGTHYDMSVIEAWRALEARLRRALLRRGFVGKYEDAGAVVRAVVRKKILHGPITEILDDLRRHVNVAVSTDPLDREAASAALAAVRHILAVVPVDLPSPDHARSGEPVRKMSAVA